MQLDTNMIEKIEAIALLVKKSPEKVLNEALDSYMAAVQERMAEEERKETALSYDEFWDGVDI